MSKKKLLKPQTLLLTEDLQKKVEAKMKACYEIATKHYNLKFEFPEVRYDIKSRVGGLAFYQLNLIRYNLILLVENEEDYIKNTVPHEVAHLIAYKVWQQDKTPNKKKLMPHGKLWKEVMGVLEVVPEVKHYYDCTSIQRFAKRKARVKVDRVTRILKQIARLTHEELYRLNEGYDASR
jgi:predicted SprT family Zn-dependent metalloprotease